MCTEIFRLKAEDVFLGKLKLNTSWWISFIIGERLLSMIVNGILLPKLFWPTVRKNCPSDWDKLLKFKAEGWEFSKILRSLEQFIQTVKGQNNFW